MSFQEGRQQAERDLSSLRVRFGETPELSRLEAFVASLPKIGEIQETTQHAVSDAGILDSVGNDEESETSVEHLINEVCKKGRLRGYAALGLDYSRKRGGGGSGFGFFKDGRMHQMRPFPELGTLNSPNAVTQSIGFGTRSWAEIVKEAGADAAISLSQVRRQEAVYEEQIPAKGLKKIFGGTKPPKQVGTKSVPIPVSKFVGNNNEEPAFQVVYCVTGGVGEYKKGNPYTYAYADPVTGRTGNTLLVSIVLPEKIARLLWQQAQKDPTIMRRIVEKMDPDLLTDQEKRNSMKGLPGLQKEKKVLLIPESENPEKFVPVESRDAQVVDVHW
ncbi:hypothetical protein CL635_01980 [bacterium]|nr:hypothetical protein [bacterium]|tara:strand:- start:4220 stop:5212 length:993 start_codon:yes stop_codon:yes gene_type:complete